LFFGQAGQSVNGCTEGFGYDFFGIAHHEFGEKKSVFFTKITIVEDEEKFAARVRGLNRMGYACGKEPDVAL
jgi:hypothetical protein